MQHMLYVSSVYVYILTEQTGSPWLTGNELVPMAMCGVFGCNHWIVTSDIIPSIHCHVALEGKPNDFREALRKYEQFGDHSSVPRKK